jgi:hypothetical protein
MRQYQRLIKIAIDKLSGETLDGDEIFDKKKDAFEIRKKYHKKELLPICCECDQDLTVSGSKNDRIHFKHKPQHSYCILTDGNISPEEHEKFTEILRLKESERHKQLKNKIGNLLHKVDGVDKSSIAIDNKFIIRNGEKRRPDVYCKYYDKELVFEIQLSDLSLGYIWSRYEFYKKHSIYLIWILDNFDIRNQGTLERDIKYLTKHQNFFKLDENATETLHLECKYKYPFLTEENALLQKWLKTSVTLSQLKFDDEFYQIYYFNYADSKTQVEIQQRKRTEEIEIEKKKIAIEQSRHHAETNANNIIREIKELRARKAQSFLYISMQISELDKYELQVLNSCLGFTKKSPIIHWISTATPADIAFMEFILNCNEIDLDVNVTDKDGKTALQVICENKEIRNYYYVPIIKLLFKRGYRLTDTDNAFFSGLSHLERDKIDFMVYEFCNNLTDRTLVDAVFKYSRQLCVIESARQQKIYGFNYKSNEWVAFANNAIDHYREHWEYIELAFKKYGLWEALTNLDKKGTFANKVRSFYSAKPKQDRDFDKVFRELYPDLGSLENAL